MNSMSVREVVRASLRRGVHGDHVARLQLVIFERDQRSCPSAFFTPFWRQHVDDFFGAAVDGIMQLHALQREIVAGFDRDGDFFDGTDLASAPGCMIFTVGRVVLARFDEIILAQANALALARWPRSETSPSFWIGTFAMSMLPLCDSSAMCDPSSISITPFLSGRSVSTVEFGDRAGNGAQIAARIFHRILHAPARRGNDR